MKVTDRIVAIPLTFFLTSPDGRRLPRFVQSYLLRGDDAVLLVDTGVRANFDALGAALSEEGLGWRDVSLVLITHAHADHAGGNERVKEASGAPLLAHAADAAWLADHDLQFRARPVGGFFDNVGKAIPPDRLVDDGDTLDLGGLTVHILHTPGHSPGSLSLFVPEAGVLLTADAIQPTGGRPIYDDAVAAAATAERLLALEGVRVVLKSHDAEAYRGDDAAAVLRAGRACLDRMAAAVESARRELGADAPLADLARHAFERAGFPDTPLMPITLASVEAHLRLLG